MAKSSAPEASFTNSRGRVISTSDPATAEKYRRDPRFTEVPTEVEPYDKWTNKRLEDEIEARNDAADEFEELIEVEPPANKPQLVAALEADDARRAAADPTDPVT